MADINTSPARILVDGHGGDHAPEMVLDAVAHLLKQRGQAPHLGIVGLRDAIMPALESRGIAEQVAYIPATETIGMDDTPSTALRRKKDSTMHVGARMVRDGEWDAWVSAGNTGALMAISKLILKTLPGIDRPAIASMIPAVNSSTLMLDAGANVDCTSDHLTQFAVMGSCYMKAAEDIKSPCVGLLNIGREDMKGTDVIKMTAAKLKDSGLNFVGNAEGIDIFKDHFDVIVCDGFTGNVALKTMEGAATFFGHYLHKELTGSLSAKIGVMFARKALNRFKLAIDPGEYNGAPLLGLNGIVVKSHGGVDHIAFANAIDVARREVESGLSSMIEDSINNLSGISV